MAAGRLAPFFSCFQVPPIMRRISLCFFLLSVAFACLPAIALADTRKPNIIYILADDLGYGDLSCYGQTKFATPNLDRMAAEGMRFTQHYAGSTVCAPTRCVLMTGLHTGHCVIRGNAEVQPIGQQPMPGDTVTLPKLLKAAGYATGAFGKWGLGYPGSEGDPLNQGFDEFFGYNCQRNAHTYYPTWLYDNDQQIELDGKTYAHDLIMDRALQFIRDHKDQPFFCYLPVTIPHAAMQVPEQYSAPFREKFPQFNGQIGRYAGTEVDNAVAAFAGMMTKLDEDVGRVLALLQELKLDENTLVMFSSDNGPHVEGGHQPDFFASSGPLRGKKRDLTDGGIRVPLIARWPGQIQPGKESSLISAHWDMLPTLCQLAGAQVPSDTDGISLLPTLLGAGKQPQHDYLYWEFHERGGKRAVRFGPWKGVQVQMKNNPDAPIAIYNIEEDIDESEDLSEQHPELVAKVRKLFDEAHVPSERFAWGFE